MFKSGRRWIKRWKRSVAGEAHATVMVVPVQMIQFGASRERGSGGVTTNVCGRGGWKNSRRGDTAKAARGMSAGRKKALRIQR